jgi:hypothetical protein
MERIEKMIIDQIVMTKTPAVGDWINVDPASGLVTGLVLRSDQADADGDRIAPAVIEKSEWAWAAAGGPRKPVLQEHNGPPLRDVNIIQFGMTGESPLSIYGAGGVAAPAGSWFLQLECGPATMKKITEGQLRGLSCEGTAVAKRLGDGEEYEISAEEFALTIARGIIDGLGLLAGGGGGFLGCATGPLLTFKYDSKTGGLTDPGTVKGTTTHGFEHLLWDPAGHFLYAGSFCVERLYGFGVFVLKPPAAP